MRQSKRLKAVFVAVVVVCWGAIGANIYLNFFKKSAMPTTAVLDLATGQIQSLPR